MSWKDLDMRVLKPDAQDDVDDFIAMGGEDHGCQCAVSNPPCGWCTHPGNTEYIQEHDDAWYDAEYAFENWLSGTTCQHYKGCKEIFWRSDDGRFIIFKHNSHSVSYGWQGKSTCGVHYSLYDLNEKVYDPYGKNSIKKWKGRFLKRYWDECMEKIQEVV